MKCGGPGQRERRLVNKITYVRKGAVTQFHAHEFRPNLTAQALLESLKCVTGQVRLEPQQPQEGFAIGLAIVVARQTARWPDRQGEWNCPCAGFGAVGRSSDEVDPHREILPPGMCNSQWRGGVIRFRRIGECHAPALRFGYYTPYHPCQEDSPEMGFRPVSRHPCSRVVSFRSKRSRVLIRHQRTERLAYQ